MLSNTDLAAYLFGWISLGLGIWQGIFRHSRDFMSFIYYFLSGAPINQFILSLAMMHRAPEQNINYDIGQEKPSDSRRHHSRRSRRRHDAELGHGKLSKRHKIRDKLGDWGNWTARALDSTLGQAIAIYIITSIMVTVWVVLDLSQRETRTLIPVKYPVGPVKWFAWCLGWCGWLHCPRLVQIRQIVKARTTEGLAIGVFTLLTLENIIILSLYFYYGNHKRPPPSKLHWTYVWGYPIKTGDFERRLAWSNGMTGSEEEDDQLLPPSFASPPLGVILPHHYPDERSRDNAHRFRDEQTRRAISEGQDRNAIRRQEAAVLEKARQDRKRKRHQDKIAARIDSSIDAQLGFIPPSKRENWRKVQRQRLKKQFSNLTNSSKDTSSTVHPIVETVPTWDEHQEAQARNDEAREEYLRIQGLPLRHRAAPFAAYHRKFIEPGGYEEVQREELERQEASSSESGSDSSSSDETGGSPTFHNDRYPLLSRPRPKVRPRLSRQPDSPDIVEEGGDAS
ncbi:hypothetical protein RQP46_004842 [Phenoliferia psychrophenolica]